MLIVCPACASEYRIDAERVGAAGRSVRCAACRETWFISPDDVATAVFEEMSALGAEAPAPGGADAPPEGAAPGAAAPEEPAPRPRPRAVKRRASEKPRAGGRRLSPALAAALAVAALVPLALLGRATVVRAMPQTAGLFAAIGLPVNLRGVELRDIAAFRAPAEGANPARLVVEGDVVGVARERVAVPAIEVEVRDDHGQTLYRWSVPAPRAALEPGERARFSASLSAPPEQGRGVEVRFAAAGPDEARAESAPAGDRH